MVKYGSGSNALPLNDAIVHALMLCHSLLDVREEQWVVRNLPQLHYRVQQSLSASFTLTTR